MFRLVLVICLKIGCLISLCAMANAANQANYYRTFWNPQYHAKRLDYCLDDKKTCGKAVANRYCQAMGYDKATEFTIAYDVGVTHFFETCVGCKGWNCQSFKKINCVAKHLHEPTRPYYFRYREFAYPRFNHYRIDWCYQQQQGCGKRAAISFCRRMGYSKATSYTKETHVRATRALGNQRLCFGEQCDGFKRVTCYR